MLPRRKSGYSESCGSGANGLLQLYYYRELQYLRDPALNSLLEMPK